MTDGISKLVQHIGRDYVRFFNKKYSRTGTLWEGRFRSCLVQTEYYFLNCQRYIELNPVRANLVEHPVDYHWSSFHSNAMGVKSDLLCPHPAYLSLGVSRAERLREYRKLFDNAIPAESIASIRVALNKGLVLGSDSFVERIESDGGQSGGLMKTGPKGPWKKIYALTQN